MMLKILTAGAGLAALAATAPAAAQYHYGYPQYGYAQYGAYGQYAHPNARITQMAASQCTAAVQARLNRQRGLPGVLGSVLGVPQTQARVLTVTSVTPSSTRLRVRGLASSGRMAYNPYGYGYYGALGYNYANAADLSFRCDVDYRGRVRNIDFDRRR